MEFFDWISVPQIVLMFMDMTAETTAEAVNKLFVIQIITLAGAAALYLMGLLFGGFGLMRMAKVKGMKNWWLGFLPFGNTYLAGKLAGESSAFGVRIKRTGLWALLSEVVYVLLEVTLIVITFLFLNEAFYEEVVYDEVVYYQFSAAKATAAGFGGLVTAQTVLEVIAYLSRIVALFYFFVMFTAFFRKYYIRSPFLMAFLCSFLPVRGFVIFAVRNNTPVDYNAYMRRQMEEYQRRQQQRYGTNAGGYSAPGNPDDPFSEFGGGSGGAGGSSDGGSGGADSSGGSDDPFSDF